jgi:hypothetical protein
MAYAVRARTCGDGLDRGPQSPAHDDIEIESAIGSLAALANNRWNAFWRKISLYGVTMEVDCTA